MRKLSRRAVATLMVCFGIMAVNSSRGFADAPIIDTGASSFEPNSGCCSTIVAMRGQNFGVSHDGHPDRDVLAKSSSQTWAQAEVLPIVSWNDTRIEAEIPCNKWDASVGPVALSVRVVNEDGYSNMRVFTLYDCTSPTSIETVNPDRGICKTTIRLQNPDGQFGVQQTEQIDTTTKTAVTRIVEFVGSAGTFTALNYPAWANTEIRVKFLDFYIDGSGPNGVPGDGDDTARNFIQDVEPTISLCDGMALGEYNVYIRYIFFADENNNVQLDDDENIYQVENSGPKVFELTNDPIIYGICPRAILPGELLKILGVNFSSVQGDGEVRVGGSTVANDPDLGLGYNLQTVGGGFREVNWEGTRIRLYMPTNTAYFDNKIVCIWVEKDGVKSNHKKVQLLAPLP